MQWLVIFFFFNDTATTEIYTLSLHDALPIFNFLSTRAVRAPPGGRSVGAAGGEEDLGALARLGGEAHLDDEDRKSTRLNSSHANISYAVFCLKKKKNKLHNYHPYDYIITI